MSIYIVLLLCVSAAPAAKPTARQAKVEATSVDENIATDSELKLGTKKMRTMLLKQLQQLEEQKSQLEDMIAHLDGEQLDLQNGATLSDAVNVAAEVDATGGISIKKGAPLENPKRFSLLSGADADDDDDDDDDNNDDAAAQRRRPIKMRAADFQRDNFYKNKVCGGTGTSTTAGPGKEARAFRWLNDGHDVNVPCNPRRGDQLCAPSRVKCQALCDDTLDCAWWSYHSNNNWCIGCKKVEDTTAHNPPYYTKGYIKNLDRTGLRPGMPPQQARFKMEEAPSHYDNWVCPLEKDKNSPQRSFRWLMGDAFVGDNKNVEGLGEPTLDGCKKRCKDLSDCAWFAWFDDQTDDNIDWRNNSPTSHQWCIGCKGPMPTEPEGYGTEGYKRTE